MSASVPAGSYLPPSLHTPHKPCMARFLRSSNVPESSLPPSYPNDPQTPHSSSSGYHPHPHRDRIGPPAFHPHPGQPHYGPLAPAHGVYTPLYDSRRVWRPQVSLLLMLLLDKLRTDGGFCCSCTSERTPGATRCPPRCCTPRFTSLLSGRGSTPWTATTALQPSTERRCTGWVHRMLH